LEHLQSARVSEAGQPWGPGLAAERLQNASGTGWRAGDIPSWCLSPVFTLHQFISLPGMRRRARARAGRWPARRRSSTGRLERLRIVLPALCGIGSRWNRHTNRHGRSAAAHV